MRVVVVLVVFVTVVEVPVVVVSVVVVSVVVVSIDVESVDVVLFKDAVFDAVLDVDSCCVVCRNFDFELR